LRYLKNWQKKIKRNNNSILLETTPIKINPGKKEILIRNKDGRETSINYSNIISTIPVDILIGSLDPQPPDSVIRAVESLKHRNLILFYLVINQDRLFEDSFIFYPEEKYIFNRLSEQKGFSKYMIPENKTVLCVEITCAEDDDKWNTADEVLYNKAIIGLNEAGIIKDGTNIEEYIVRRLTNAYPVYDKKYKENLNIVLEYLDALRSIYPIGRQGIFNYCGMADAMDMGFTAAEQIIEGGSMENWRKKRERFDNYVTVD